MSSHLDLHAVRTPFFGGSIPGSENNSQKTVIVVVVVVVMVAVGMVSVVVVC